MVVFLFQCGDFRDAGLFSCDFKSTNFMITKKQYEKALTVIKQYREQLNKPAVISSVCECKRLENGKIVMCQKCLVDLTEIEQQTDL